VLENQDFQQGRSTNFLTDKADYADFDMHLLDLQNQRDIKNVCYKINYNIFIYYLSKKHNYNRIK